MAADDAHADGARAACTTSSAAASTATRSTRSGWCRTSRRCSTTTRSSPRSTCTAGWPPATPSTGASPRRRSTTCCGEMRHPAGGFFSAQDADSEGEEGKFFVWSPDEIRAALLGDRDGQRPRLAYWGVREGPNFEGHSILVRPARTRRGCGARLGISRAELLAAHRPRARALYGRAGARVPPGLDDKVLAAWNGLACSRLRRGRAPRSAAPTTSTRPCGTRSSCGAAMRPRRTPRSAPGRTAWRADHRLPRGPRHGRRAALLHVYEATFDRRWLDDVPARSPSRPLRLFWDARARRSSTPARTRRRSWSGRATCSTTPCPAAPRWPSIGCCASRARGRAALRGDRARGAAPDGRPHRGATRPASAATCPRSTSTSGPVARGRPRLARARDGPARRRSAPGRARALPAEPRRGRRAARSPAAAGLPLLADRTAVGGQPTAYVCRHYVCQLPATDPRALARQLDCPERRRAGRRRGWPLEGERGEAAVARCGIIRESRGEVS